MMAVKSPMMASPSGLVSAFSPYSDSPSTPGSHKTNKSLSSMAAERSSRLHPIQSQPLAESVQAAQAAKSPSSEGSQVAPSPVSADGTEIDDSSDHADEVIPPPVQVNPPVQGTIQQAPPAPIQTRPPSFPPSRPPFNMGGPSLSLNIGNMQNGNHDPRPQSDEDEPPQSVIHAPKGFSDFKARNPPPRPPPVAERAEERTETSPSQKSDATIKSPATLTVNTDEKKGSTSPVSPPPISTSVTPLKDMVERPTPRAQTRQEVEALERHSRPSSNLEDIPEAQDYEGAQEPSKEDVTPSAPQNPDQVDKTDPTVGNFQDTEEELKALRTALSECWTLCNTLASLSYIHRERLFNFAGKGDMQEQAWKSCWKLCQKLYDSRDEDHASQVRPTLDLCREFCQALFEVRVRDNEVADSVLRVSFELNNHLYNTHDRNLPEAFRERTLDFYITLCHRLMKQRTRLAEETDSLLRACWSLAEMLFSLRQNKREGKRADEELLGSAVQACWELCDLFREGWTQIRPDRGTPRPSQTTFTQAFNQAKRSEQMAAEQAAKNTINPETPTTIFEDTLAVSPDEENPVPNILVLGPDSLTSNASLRSSSASRPPQNIAPWSSASSTYSRASTTSSTNTVTTPSEDPNLTRLKLLVIKAAMISGYQRGGAQSLPTFVKSMPSNSFGSMLWHTNLLAEFKKLVLADPAFRTIGPPTRAGAADVALAVLSMVQSGQYVWLRDLFRLVFGFHVEEAGDRKVSIQT